METSAFKLNPRVKAQWKAAIADLASIANKTDPESLQKVVTLSARRFVRNVADVTPPASGKADGAAKKRGEDAILGDLLKIAIPTTAVGSTRAVREALATAEDLMAAHDRAVKGASGRVNPRNRKEKLFLSQGSFNKVLATLQKRVGWLAAGLNAAAGKLGITLPAWIKRHGSKYGAITVNASATSIRILITQNVPYTDNVNGYERRWNFALLKEVSAIQNQIKAIWARKTAKAKARLK